MKVNKFIEKLKENYSEVHKLYLTRNAGEYLCDGNPVAFTIKDFGKRTEEVAEISEAPANFPQIAEIVPSSLNIYEEPETSEHYIEVREKVVIKEIIKEVPIEKLIIKEVPVKEIIEKEKIIYKDKVLDWKIKIV